MADNFSSEMSVRLDLKSPLTIALTMPFPCRTDLRQVSQYYCYPVHTDIFQ